MNLRLAVLMFAAATCTAARADELRAYAGVVAGNVMIGPQFMCATSGPTIGNGWFAGLALPTEGIAACGLVGGADDKIAAAGPLASSFAASGPMAPVAAGVPSGIFSGSAAARADYWSLGVRAQGSASGASSSGTYRQAAAFASFEQMVTLNSPGLATGTAGSVDFAFLLEGLASSLNNPPYSQQLDVGLQFRVDGRYVWDAARISIDGADLPYVRGGSTGLPGSFVLGAGTIAGSALVTTTANFGIQWGVPFKLEVVLRADAQPCCYGTSQNIDFYNSATLAGIVARGPGGAVVSDFSVLTASGPPVGPGGLLPVPEPRAAVLMLLGIAGLGLVKARRRR